ncbi:uncharacterized protein LOC123204278 isoform X5 [Mangifera indica]|uniref:uncharacterized protein LOC123204278 isoform X5 n=1 Tax=Mangifera indica TaxID=29780 RepID=UPI001CF9B454|nr:uncharacterized protein LOC123204278 isoform X5 [Mangifera indica]
MLCSGNKSLYTLAKMRLNWELKNCCHHDQVVFPVTVSVCAVVILVLEKLEMCFNTPERKEVSNVEEEERRSQSCGGRCC